MTAEKRIGNRNSVAHRPEQERASGSAPSGPWRALLTHSQRKCLLAVLVLAEARLARRLSGPHQESRRAGNHWRPSSAALQRRIRSPLSVTHSANGSAPSRPWRAPDCYAVVFQHVSPVEANLNDGYIGEPRGEPSEAEEHHLHHIQLQDNCHRLYHSPFGDAMLRILLPHARGHRVWDSRVGALPVHGRNKVRRWSARRRGLPLGASPLRADSSRSSSPAPRENVTGGVCRHSVLVTQR